MRVLLASFSLLVIAACQPAPPGHDGAVPSPAGVDTSGADDPSVGSPVELRTDRAHYRPSDRVGLTFVNRAEATYSFNPCFRTVEREAGDGWVPVEEPGRACTMEAWLIEPGATRLAHTELPDTLGAGPYRLAVALAREGSTPPAEHTQAVSAPFRVEP